MVTHLFTCVVALGLGLFIELRECTPTLIFDRQGVTPTDPNRNRVDLVCREDGADINATFWNGTTQLNPLPSPTHTHDLTADTEAEIVCSDQDGLMSGEITLAALPEEQNLQDNPPRTKFVRRGETVELPCDYCPGNLRELYEVFWSVHELGGSDVIYRPNALPLGDLLSIDEDTFALTVAVNRTGDQYHCIVDVRLNNIGTRKLRYEGATIELTDEALTATVEPTANSDSDSHSDDSVLSEEVRTVIFVLAGIVAFVIVVISCVCSLRILYKQGKITTDSRVIRNRPLLQRMVSGERYPRINHSPNEYHDYEHMDAELGSLRPGSEVPAHFFQPSDVSDQEEVYNLSRGSGGSSVFLPRHTPSVSIPGSQACLQQPFKRSSYAETESEYYQKLFPNKEGRERRASQISTQSTGNLSVEVSRMSPAPTMLPGYPNHLSPKTTAVPKSVAPSSISDEILRHVVGCLMHRQDCQIPHCPCRDVQQRYHELLIKDVSATQEPPKPPPYDNKKQHLHLSLSQQNLNSNEHPHWHLHTKSHIRRTRKAPLLRQRSKSVDLTPIIEMREMPAIEKHLTPTPIDKKRVLHRGRNPTHQQGRNPTHQQGRNPTHQQEYGYSHLREHSPAYLQICSPTHLRGHSPTHHYTEGNSNKLSHRQEAFNVSSHIMHVSNSDFNEATITSASSYGQITNVSVPITDTVKYGSAGGMYINQIHDVTIQIPEKAVPEGTYFQLSISAMLHGHFLFPEGVRPVSPIIWLCPQPTLTFSKPIEVVLPHYLHCENKKDTENLIFMKANHHPINGKFHFKPADGESIFKHHTSYGTLHTTHCCFLCITTKTTERETPKINFSLITAYPRNPQEHSWSVYFGVTVLLSSCMQTFKRQFKAADYQINNPQIFTMQDTAEKKIKICYQEHLPQQWMAGLSGSDEVLASEVDFWNYTPTDLKTMEDEKMYPPRFEVLIDGRSAIGDSMLTVNFSGIKKKLMVKIPLRPTTGAQAKLPDREPITPITDEQNDTIELKELCLELQTVDDWFDLGVYLHIPYSKLKIIEVEYQNTHRRRTEMLQAWLNNFQPSWSTVIEALKLIDMSQLAKKLAAKKKIPGPTYRLTQYNPTHHYRTSSTGHGTRGRSPLHLPEPLASETLC